MNVVSDIYWSHVCINALKTKDLNLFHYGLYFIEDIDRQIKLIELCEKVIAKDDETLNILNNYSYSFIVHIA